MSEHFSALVYAYGKPAASGKIKQSPSDFIVTEELSFISSGEGEHLFLQIQKIELNTLDVCERLAKHFQIHPRHISYAGLKDRNAVTTQWFCLRFAIKSSPDFSGLESSQLKVLSVTRNTKKLKRGAIKNNQFEITVCQLQYNGHDIKNRIDLIQKKGVPNYFGAQRFGKNENNLLSAAKLFQGKMQCNRNKKSIYLSAARSFLFNEIVSRRVKNKTWKTLLDGDVAMLNASRSFFVIDSVDSKIHERLNQGDIHPSAALWGKGNLETQFMVKELEHTIINANLAFADGLVKHGLQQDRRATRLLVPDLEYDLSVDTLKLKFSLPSGTYATCVLREIIDVAE